MKKQLIAFFSLVILLFAPSIAFAQFGDAFGQFFGTTVDQVYNVDQDQNLENELPLAIGRIISIVLSIVGVVLLVIIFYAGILWLTARGESAQVDKAKSLIRNGIIGIAITFGAFLISTFVVTTINNAIQNANDQTTASFDNFQRVNEQTGGGIDSFQDIQNTFGN